MDKSTPAVRVLVVGGGAAGYMAAITAAEAGADVTLWERGRTVLAKVRVSGGGRCNVTNAETDPRRLVENYPRGGHELRGPLHRFGPKETRAWFESRGVPLKTEKDGRIFPRSDDAATVVEALIVAARRAGVRVRTGVSIEDLRPEATGFRAGGDTTLRVDRLLLATGSGAQGWTWARAFGHTIVSPVPSLFTFSIRDPRLDGLAGVSVPAGRLSLDGFEVEVEGPVLVTHWGLSGPAVLRLSAWAARWLHHRHYRASLKLNWTGEKSEAFFARLTAARTTFSRRRLSGDPPEPLPLRLWERLAAAAGLPPDTRWADASNDALRRLVQEVVAGRYTVEGKGAFKEEFVTAGGVALPEVNFQTMESRIVPGLFFAGEILDIDGVTGGFNFQSAWTTGWIAGRALAQTGRRD